MKKIKFLMIAMMAIMTAACFTACSDDDDNISNMERYQQEVDKAVQKGKKHNKAILLVMFGSTWQQAYDAFDLTKSEYEKNFPDYDVFMSFSSIICINRARAAENTASRDFYEPSYWLQAMGKVQYSEIIVQSMQVIPGEEYGNVLNAVKKFANNATADIDDKYLSQVKIRIGTPLMAMPEDVNKLAVVLNKQFRPYAEKGAMLFMGHGNPDKYDTYKANVRYTQLEEALKAFHPNYFVGTVDMMDNFKVQVHDRMVEAGLNSGNVYCAPLMSIAGDHAHNDMAGDDDAWDNGFEVNDEGEVEDTSWKMYFSHLGYTIDKQSYTDTGNGLVKGLLEYPEVRALYMAHTKNAVEDEDLYHSMYPEE